MIVAAGLAAAYAAIEEPMYAALAVAAGALGLVALAAPGLATPVAVLLIYSNVTVVAVRFHDVPKLAGQAVIALLLVPLLHELVLRRRPVVVHPILALLFLFGALQGLALLFSENPAAAVPALVEYLVEGLLVFFLITNVVRTEADLRRATWALLLAGLIMSAVPIYQQVTRDFDSVYGGFGQTTDTGFRTGGVTDRGSEVRQHRLSGTIGEQNRFAQNLLMLVPLGLSLVWSERRRGPRLLAAGLTCVAGLGCVLSFSRGSAVAFAMMLAVMVVMRLVTPRQLLALGLGALLVTAALPQYWARLTTMQNLPGLFSGDVSHETNPDSSFKGRLTEMLAAGMVFADHPVVGVGPGLFGDYSQEYGNRLGIRRLEGARQAHSLYLGIAAETGVAGIACFLAVLFVACTGLLETRRRWKAVRPELAHAATGYFLAILAYMTTGLFLHMSYARFFYLVLGLGAAVITIGGGRAGPAGPEPAAALDVRR